MCALVAATLPLRASGPVFWTVATSSDFLAGTSDGVFVSLQGVLTPGPSMTSRLSTTPAQVWSLAQADDGTLFAGTGGGKGQVLRIRPGEPDAVIFEAEESNIFAVALGGTRVYAASSPDGRIYAIDADGTSSTFFDPAEKYIWALGLDAEGRLWVGAGTPAVMYRVTPDGTGTAVYHPPADHVVSLTRDAQGRLLAGTESPGRLYRLDGDRPFALLDPGLTELRAIAVGPGGEVFAAGVDRGSTSPSDGETTSVAVVAAASATTAGSSSSPAASSSGTSRRSAVFRIATDGQWERIWQTPDLVYDLSAEPDGSVLAATGPAGRLYRITPERDVLLYTGVDARQITRFGGRTGPSGALASFATANPGRVVSLGAGRQSPATYVSDVRDTNSVATWGLVRWESSGDVSLFTRAGNTEEADASWSDWAGPYTASAGATIASPSARYVQWKAELKTSSGGAVPTLTSVTLAYLPRNSRPVVESITLQPPGVVFQRPFASDDTAIAGLDDAIAGARRPPGDSGPPAPTPTRRMFQKGLQTIQWSAADADDDRLIYALQYRRDGASDWQTLREGLYDPIYVWDTTAMADGRYVVRVVATDSPSNASDRASSGERDSAPVTIDNTPPAVTTQVSGQGEAARLVVTVLDGQSPIRSLEYSVGGGPWQIVYPSDGLADSPEERYEIPLGSAAEAARIMVRATDLLQNVTSVMAGGR
jgi:hypothetical protein